MGWGVVVAIGLLVQSIASPSLRVFVGLTFWWILIGIGLTLTGLGERMRLMTQYGVLVILTGLIFEAGIVSGLIQYLFALLGFGIFVGVGLALVGWLTDRAVVPIGVYMLFGSVLEYLAPPSLSWFIDLVWLMLAGASFASFGFVKKSAFSYFTGMAFIFGVVTAFVLGGGGVVTVGLVGFAIIAGALLIGFLYMFRTLGRTPHVEEILTLAARALFTYGLRKPLDQYRVIAITIQGDIATELIINELLTKIEERWRPIVLLGPTSPTQIVRAPGLRLGWVTSLTGITGSYTLLSPANPSDVNIFLSGAMKDVSNSQLPVLIGDFLDNMIPLMREDAFYKYYSELASRIRVLNYTAVFIIKSDIHPEVAVNIVKRFADVIIENREREDRNRIVREVRISNKIDNFQTDWQTIPRVSSVAAA